MIAGEVSESKGVAAGFQAPVNDFGRAVGGADSSTRLLLGTVGFKPKYVLSRNELTFLKETAELRHRRAARRWSTVCALAPNR